MSPTDPGPSTHWPLFDLVVTTPRLTLRYVDDQRAADLMDLVASDGVHDPNERPFMTPWTQVESPRREREGMQGYWRARAATGQDGWTLPFAVYDGATLVGAQDLRADAFPVTHTVRTSSWVARSRHGQGIGREMRAAVLQLAFAGLGAELATSGSFADNIGSIRVSRSLGYVENGWQLSVRDGQPARDLSFLLERAVWDAHRRDDIRIEGLATCLPSLGLPPSAT